MLFLLDRVENLEEERSKTFSVHRVVESRPSVAQPLTLSVVFSFYFILYYYDLKLPCSSTFYVVGSLAKLKLQARPAKEKFNFT